MFNILDFSQTKDLIDTVFDAENEEIIIKRWISEGFSRQMGLEEFKKMLNKPKSGAKTADEILKSVEKMMNSTSWKDGLNGDI